MATFVSSPSFACYFHNKRSHNPKFSCKASAEREEYRIDRRNILIGMAGTVTILNDGPAQAEPVTAPHISKCHLATVPQLDELINCCPPYNNEQVIDFKLPSLDEPFKFRPAAHLVRPEYLEKYKKAVELMKALPKDDPRSFMQQANVHCAYCNGAYGQEGYPNVQLQVHGNWLFFPWHRLFLYFHERILGKLIGDETFGLPFWNWDAPDGMMLPSIYTDPSTSLYDSLRNAEHQPPTVVNLDDNCGTNPTIPCNQLIGQNLNVMYRQVISCGATAELFMGSPYRAGKEAIDGSGSLEKVPHNTVHTWTGDPSQNNQHMGLLFSAARDPVFYAHHANVDRVWKLWKEQGGKRRDFYDRDFLEASFLFYDENARLVRVKVKDCLVQDRLRYRFQDLAKPWLDARPTPYSSIRSNKPLLETKKTTATATEFPWNLDSKSITTTVNRPRVSRSKEDKDEEEEVLLVDIFEYEMNTCTKFDVYINIIDYEGVGPESSEFAGSFVNVPHEPNSKNGKTKMKLMKTKLKLGINELLEDIEAEDDESLLVTLVPRSGKVKIGEVKIAYSM